MNRLPTHIIFQNIKECLQSILWTSKLTLSLYNDELEKRIPDDIPVEYDSQGNIITNEVVGYTDEGSEVWIL